MLRNQSEKDIALSNRPAKYEDGKIYAWSDGLTSWSDAGSINVSAWECAKLVESEEK